ncbi:MAG: hypothetical protein V3V74_06735 [Nitrosomonadaceae bacterium]
MSLNTQGWFLAVTLVDNGAGSVTLQYKMRSADATEAATDAAAIIAALDAVTNAVIADYYIKHKYSESALTYPAAGIENKDKASITILLAGDGSKKANLKIPAPVIGLFTDTEGGGANVVDMSDAALVTYMDLFKSGQECYISDGEDLSKGVSGKRIGSKTNFG